MGNDWDQAFDVVVVGTGAGGMTAALTARAAGASVVLVEKAARYGGSTALSGRGHLGPEQPHPSAPGSRRRPRGRPEVPPRGHR